MEFRVEEVCIDGPIEEQRHAVLTIERNELVMESLGMSLSEGKAMLSGGQDVVIAQQAREYLEQQRTCPDCGRLHTSKDAGAMPVKTVFGSVQVANPRRNRCACQGDGPQTFRPMRQWMEAQTSPEMAYLETNWASLSHLPRWRICYVTCCQCTAP